MRWLMRIRMVLSDLLRRDRFERDMDDELQSFLALETEERERSGASSEEARRAALVRFGGVEATKERLRDHRAGAALESAAQDLRFSVRMLRRNPGFTAAAVVTIAIGVCPLTAVLGLANMLFFRAAPGVTDPEELVQVEFIRRSERGGTGRASISYANFAELRNGQRVLTDLAGRATTSVSIAGQSGEARRIGAEIVMHNYFQVLGMPMAAGRPFLPEEDREPAGAPVAILSYALSRTLFGEPASALGRSVRINGLRFTVIGVAAQGFHGTQPDEFSDTWFTGATSNYLRHIPRERWDRSRTNGVFNVFVGRMAPNAGLDLARAELTRAMRALADAYPQDNEKFRTAEVRMERRPGIPLNRRNSTASFVTLLGGVGALLLLLAAANVANLLLFRGVRRRDEIAMRQALGATRWRLVRAHLMDSLLLSLLGGAAGVLLTLGCALLLKGAVFPGAGPLALPIDWRVVSFALAASTLMGLVFGAAPGLVASGRRDASFVVNRGGGRGMRRAHRLRNSLTVVQLAMSLSLLVGALLLLATIRNLYRVNVGFDPSRVAGLSVDLSSHGYDTPRILAFYRALIEGGAALPWIEALSLSQEAPFSGSSWILFVHRVNEDAKTAVRVTGNGVTADYFRGLGIPIVRGRGFTDAEALAAPDATCGPIVVSESLAVQFFGTRDAVGRAVVLPKNMAHPSIECSIVGVVGDVRWTSPASEPAPFLYRPLARSSFGVSRVSILARSARPPAEIARALQKVGASIDSAVPLFHTGSLIQALNRRIAERRIISGVLALLASLGLLMAAVGLHGLVSEAAAERTREFGIRIAIGAPPKTIFATVLRHALVLAAIGLAVGAGLAAALSRALRSQLFGVADFEPSIYLAAAGLLAAVVVVASLAPAIAATRVNPVEALRVE